MFCERALPLMLPWLHVPPRSLVVTCVHWYNKLHLIVNASLIDRKCIFKMGGADVYCHFASMAMYALNF